MDSSSHSDAGARSRSKTMRNTGGHLGSAQSLGADILCAIFTLLDHFDLVRCSAVCKSWQKIIYTSTLVEDLYYKKNPCAKYDKSFPQASIATLKDLALEQHRVSFLSGSTEIHQWNGHSSRVNICRMKRGVILTGGEDKLLRLWSSENYKCLNQYSFSGLDPLVDFDFDENKIVGITGSQLCIWRRNGRRSVFRSRESTLTRGLCMGYIDPEAAMGCEDGRARIFDLYSGSCTRIIRMHSAPLTCIALTEDQLILGGSTYGHVAIADISSGERLGFLKSSISPTGMKTLFVNTSSYRVYAGSTSGYAHCWDLRTLRPLWETRASPNVIYGVHHLANYSSSLAVGGLDGVLRILNQDTGEVLSSFVADAAPTRNDRDVVEVIKGRSLADDSNLDSIPRYRRPPITRLAVGMNKIVTTHGQKYIRMWRFSA
ncbi:F-box domain-containing protein [Dioscorea alata]|uniref:F-box domain-containing protein n=1 Tax=Dioscorea alata TaxID=55571 RepID=A0ACB7W5K7_DIOAL|nr:F-box domain-containing protein [Dioscorea alata]